MSYEPTGACAGCPYSGRCHDARKVAVDASGLGLGRHTVCEFYRSFERERTRPVARKVPRTDRRQRGRRGRGVKPR